MANVSAYSAKALLDWTLKGASAPTDPTTIGVGLSLGAPTSVSGSEMATNSGYTRKTAGFAAAASPGGSATLNTAITFGPFSTAYSITGIQIWDTFGVAVDAGNMLWYGNLATARTIASGDSLVIASGALTVSLA
jgi:hypothetical protein